MSDIEIEIDGKKLAAKPNQMLIEVADAAGIYIPRFCYHKHLSIAANCRMCLVEVEKSPKVLPACATPVMAGMRVFTKSAKTIEAQRAVMEFLLINHPLDCPVCDQGGECELQDLSMGFGSSHSHYDECKRAVEDQDFGPLIATEMTRCIQCTRCVRFGDEIAGMRELGVTHRGEHAEIGTYVQQTIKSEVSGNVIDICPVGALTAKPSRFTARAWEMKQVSSVAPHDCLGSNINVHTLNGNVMRVVARENDVINETWLSDRDRFSYAGLLNKERIKQPMVRMNGKLEITTWENALQVASKGMQDSISEFGADQFGALASPSSTLEELYLLQKIVRGLGGSHVDHRLRESDTSDQSNFPAFPGASLPVSAIQDSDAILLIGSNLQKEQPLAALRVRKAIQKGAVALAVNPMDYRFNFQLTAKSIVAPQHVISTLTELVLALENSTENELAVLLRNKKKPCIILGALALHHNQASQIRALAHKIATLTQGALMFMTDGANSAGAWLAGAVPHRLPGGVAANQIGLSAYEMAKKPLQSYLLVNVDPDLDCANAAMMTAALQQANCVVALSLYRNPVLEKCAHVILPMTPFTETAGTFINVSGIWQTFQGVANAYGESRPAWKILRVLGNFLHLDGFEFEDAAQIKTELKGFIDKMPAMEARFYANQAAKVQAAESAHTVSRIGEIPIYAIDSIVRHAAPLTATQDVMEGELAAVRMHPETAKKFNLHIGSNASVRQGEGQAVLPVILDVRVPEGAAWIPGGIQATAGLGDLFGEVEMQSEK